MAALSSEYKIGQR